MKKVRAVVFDLDGVIVNSESAWEQARVLFASKHGLTWSREDNSGAIGLAPRESNQYIRTRLGIELTLESIQHGVVEELLSLYSGNIPFIQGALSAVQKIAEHYPVALASSASRVVVDEVLDHSGLSPLFKSILAGDDVEYGKPHPEIYIRSCYNLGFSPQSVLAVEDSEAGLQSALAANLITVAVPNTDYPPNLSTLSQTDLTLTNITELSIDVLDAIST